MKPKPPKPPLTRSKTPKLKFELVDWEGGFPITDEPETFFNVMLVQCMPWGDREGLTFPTAKSESKAWARAIDELQELLKKARKLSRTASKKG